MEPLTTLILSEPIQQFLHHPSFLPHQIPLATLPPPFDHYVHLLDRVHLWNCPAQGGVREFLLEGLKDCHPSSEHIDRLTYWEQEKLFSVLTLLAHSYRWNYLPPAAQEFESQEMVFPDTIWKPLTYLASKLGHPPCGTLWSIMLMNFQVKGQAPGTDLVVDQIAFDDLWLTHHWVTEEFQEQLAHWVKIFVMTEIAGTTSNKACMDILTSISKNDKEKLAVALALLLEGIRGIAAVFNREVRGQKLHIHPWRLHIQPFFVWGLKDPESQLLLEGVSGLQIGSIQLIDLILGLEMKSVMGRAMLASRRYLPLHQRQLLDTLEPHRKAVRNFLAKENDQALHGLYNQCIDALESYRISHKQRGKAYIKGDGSPRNITTTGLSVQNSWEAAAQFEADMEERIRETERGKISR